MKQSILYCGLEIFGPLLFAFLEQYSQSLCLDILSSKHANITHTNYHCCWEGGMVEISVPIQNHLAIQASILTLILPNPSCHEVTLIWHIHYFHCYWDSRNHWKAKPFPLHWWNFVPTLMISAPWHQQMFALLLFSCIALHSCCKTLNFSEMWTVVILRHSYVWQDDGWGYLNIHQTLQSVRNTE